MALVQTRSHSRFTFQIFTSICAFTARSAISEGFIQKLPLASSSTSRLLFDFGANRKYRIMSSQSVPNSEPSFDDVRKRKQELRKQLRSAMKNLTVEEINEQSDSVWNKIFELPVYRSAKSVGLFLSMPTAEINTDLILRHCVENEKNIYVPEVGKNFELCDMEFRKVVFDPDEPKDPMFHKRWPTNKWKIPEPPSGMPTIVAEPGDIDLMIMPGLGFDRKRNRLGQGKGYYDRFIEKMKKNGEPLPLVAVTLKPQLVENGDIPVAPYDQQMDMVVLPDEVIAASD